MVRVLHASDWHLDSAYGALSPEQAKQRRAESRALVAELVDYANDHGVQLLLLSGDLLDSDAVYAQTAEELSTALAAFRGAVFIAPGNHDYYSEGSPYATTLWPENVHIFKTPDMERVALPQYGCVVYGAAFTAAEDTAAGLKEFTVRDEDRDAVCIGVLHGDVGASESRYRALSAHCIARSGLTYLALGHVHRYDGVQTAGSTAYAYCGCLEGRGFDEVGEKGFLMGEVDKGSVALRFVPFARRRYQTLSVDVTGRDMYDAIVSALPPRTEDDLYRITVTGEHEEERDDLTALTQRLAPLFWAVEVRDGRTLRRDLWARCGEDSLRGIFLQNMKRRLDAAESEDERRKIELAARFGADALDGRE
ncbi:MAG: metallophosphoesterase [Oscillospiraceae bacterium]|nr:metallophosphoesterase [Oscillospiraceae bacterium]